MQSRYFCFILVVLMLSAIPTGAFAEGRNRPAQFAFFTPLQVFPESDSIKAFRFNVVYGSNQNMNGFDLGMVNRVRGNLTGVQFGVFNWVEGNGEIFQTAIVNLTEGNFRGAQLGFFNRTIKHCKGAQVGFVNMTGSLHGMQLGIFNINESGTKYMKYLPVVNWAF